MRSFGAQNMHGRLRRVLVHRPGPEFAVQDPEAWNYTARPDLERAQREHDGLCAMLAEDGCELVELGEVDRELADALFVHDPVLVTDAGAILLNMGKPKRVGETVAHERLLTATDIPIQARLEGDQRAEGGDLLWVDEGLLACGRGFRTNRAGIDALRGALGPTGVEVVAVDLPFGEGPAACLHLMSLLSIVAADLAVAHKPLLPVALVELMEARGFDWVEVPEAEFATMGLNVLAVGPRDCIVLDGNPVTAGRLEAAGCRVRAYVGEDLSLKAEGGPTCLTRPLLRD